MSRLNVSQTSASPVREGRSWRRSASAGSLRARWFAGRVLLALLVGVLVVWYVVVLRRPFEHARPQLILLGDPVFGEVPPETIADRPAFPGFVRRDLDAFDRLASVTGSNAEDGPTRLPGPTRGDDLGELRRQLDATHGSHRVAIVYAAATGVSADGRAELEWDRTIDGRRTRTRASDLLEAVVSGSSGTVLLVVDAGRCRTDPSTGMLVNEFPRLFADDVVRTGNESLWVLLSHSMLEVSHVSHVERRSVFGRSVVEGLAGDADENGNRVVDIAELARFTARTVGRWVDEQTHGHESQTPQLLWGGGSIGDIEPPALVPVTTAEEQQESHEGPGGDEGDDSKTDAKSEVDSGEKTKKGDSAKSDAPQGEAANERPATTPGDPDSLSTAAAERPASSADPSPDPTETADAANAAANGSAAVSASGTEAATGPEAPGSARTRTSAALAKRVEEIVATLSPLELRLHETWRLRDRLLERRPAGSRTAIDVTPEEWRALERLLLEYGQRVLRERDRPEALALALDRLQERFRTLDAAARTPESLTQPTSLAEIEQRAATDDPRQQWVRDFDAAIGSETDAALQAFLANTPAAANGLREVAIARECLDGGADWSRIGPLCRSRRELERLIAECGWTAAWIGDEVVAANASLRAAERVVADGVDPDASGPEVSEQLAQGNEKTALAARDAASLRAARATRNDAAFRLEDDIAWAFATGTETGAGTSVIGSRVTVEQLVEAVEEVSKLLGAENDDQLPALIRETRRLSGLRDRFGATRSPEFVRTTVESGTVGLSRESLEALLACPGTTAEVRLLARDALRHREQETTDRTSRRPTVWTARIPPVLVGERWLPYVARARNEFARRGLASNPNREEIDKLLAGVCAEGQPNTDSGDWLTRCRAFRTLGRLLKDAGEQEFASTTNAIGDEALGVLRERLAEAEAVGANASELEELDRIATITEPLGAPVVAIESASDGGATVAVTVDWRGAAAGEVWIVVETDDRLTLDERDRSAIHSADSLGVQPGDRDELRRIVREQPPSLALTPGGENRVTFALDRRAPGDSRIVVHAVTKTAARRKAAVVRAPASRVFVVGCEAIPRTYDDEPDRLLLHPFPNRETAFRLQLGTRDGAEHAVSAALYVPTARVPAVLGTPLAPADARRLLDEAGCGEPLVRADSFTVPAESGAIPIPWVPPAPGPPPAAPPAGTPSPPPGTACGRDLLLVLHDTAAGTMEVVPVGISPQRPQRYLAPRVLYDTRTRRVTLRLEPVEALAAPNGAVPVRVHLGGTPASEPTVAANISARTGGEVAATVPPELVDPVLLFVEVDGWPRAFVFRIDPNRSSDDVAEVRDRLAVRIVAPVAGALFPGTAASVPVLLEVDRPGSAKALEAGAVGFDLNGDRTLRDEAFLPIVGDRAVEPFAQVLPDGRLSLFARVTDHVVELPIPPGTSALLDIVARVDAAGRSAWSEPLTVVVDGSPPRVDSAALLAGREVVVGPPAPGVVLAGDDGLSGVATVEATFDLDGSGRFPADAKPFPALPGEGGMWQILVPTEGLAEGRHVVLVRARDRVGLVSKVVPMEFAAISAAALERRTAETPRTVRGRVTYLRNPVPGARITLAFAGMAVDGTAVEPLTAVAAADGTFTITGVKAGPYEATAKARLRNRDRVVTVPVDVPTIPAAVPIIELDLPFGR